MNTFLTIQINTHMEQIRKLMMICEGRNPELEYQNVSNEKVIAKLKSYDSQSYTKLAQKIERITALEKEIKELKAEVKSSSKERINDLFEAEDAAKTRVVETISFVFTLSKDPKETVTPKYKEILQEIETQLTPELITVLETLKKTMVTITQKSPSLKIEPVTEGIGSIFSAVKDAVLSWTKNYDRKLEKLKREANI